MIEISVSNVRSISYGKIEVDGITAVYGGNQSGKTSLCNAIAAALLGDPSMYGCTQKDQTTVISNGASGALVTVKNGDGVFQMSWPGGASQTKPNIDSTLITLGRLDPAGEFKPKLFTEFVKELCPKASKVTGKAIREELAKIPGSNDQKIAKVMQMIRDSWDGAVSISEEHRKDARALFIAATGERGFGESKARLWIDQREASLKDVVETSIADQLEKCYEAKKAKSLIEKLCGADISKLDAEIQELSKGIAEAELRKVDVDRTIEQLEDEYSSYGTGEGLTCPHCSGIVHLVGSRNSKENPLNLTLGELGKPKDARFEKLITELAEMGNEQSRIAAEIAEGKSRANELSAKRDVASKLPEDPLPKLTHQEITDLISNLEYDLASCKVLAKAKKSFEDYQWHKGVSELLGPTGIKLEYSRKSVALLQQDVNEIAEYFFPGHEVSLEVTGDGVDLKFDGYSYNAISWQGDPNSFRLRVKYLFQVLACRQIQGDTLLLLDRADTIEAKHLNEIMYFLVGEGIPTIIFSTANKKPKIDRLKDGGVGRSYWIEGGKINNV